ncbi:phosphoglycerate mutase family protein [Phycisphaerales bacterium ac7]
MPKHAKLFSLAALLSTLLLAGCASSGSPTPTMDQPPADRTVLVTRHAEKAQYSADPSLSQRGAQRAQALSLLPIAQGTETIITTQFKRTIETAQPLAERLGVESRVVNATARPDALRALADDIRAGAMKGTVLVVGHSNTVPMIITELGGPQDIFLSEEDFGDLFILSLDADGNFAGIERTRYGD